MQPKITALWGFAFVIAIPAPLFVLAFQGVDLAAYLALLYVAVILLLADEIVPVGLSENLPSARGQNFLLFAIAALHLAVLFGTITSLARGTTDLSLGAKACLFVAAGLFLGQVSNATAHELIHSKKRLAHEVGKWIYVSLLFGHHTSAHMLVHHVWVATPNDPNSARRGQSFWGYLPQAWLGSFLNGFAAEKKRYSVTLLNPYFTYVCGAFLILLSSYLLAGFSGIFWHVLLAGYATAQLLQSDYIQHYGLRREKQANGRYVPFSTKHSWNSRHSLTSFWTLNASKHSDHHANPAKPFNNLEIEEDANYPLLPYSLPVMGFISYFPWWWRRVMKEPLEKWSTA